MKIKQIGRNYDGNIIPIILENREIENIDLLYNPNDKDDIDPFYYYGISTVAKMFISHLLVDSHFCILVDPDADGYTSAAIITKYIKKVKPNIKIDFIFHKGKEHGLTNDIVNEIINIKPEILIIPDAGSNDDENLKILSYSGTNIIIIDHHEVENFPSVGFIINNQLKQNEKTNKNLTGAGMALRFCQVCDKYIQKDYAEKFYDLAAIGQIGDGSNISDNEIRNIVFKGLNNINNEFFKTVIKDYFPDKNIIAPINLSFSIIPLINSIVRIGNQEEKELLFNALIMEDEIAFNSVYKIQKKKKNKETNKFDTIEIEMNFYEYVLNICKKIKLKQAPLIKSIVNNEDFFDNTGGIAIGIVDILDDNNSVIGLAANKIVNKFQKPALVLHELEDCYTGSARGHEKTISNFKQWCLDTKLVKFAQGHSNAFGISIQKENFNKFKEETKKLQQKDFIYEVDLIINNTIPKKAINDVNENLFLFGGKVNQPLFAFLDLNIKKSWIKKRGSMLTFYKDGVEFVMYNTPEQLYDKLSLGFEQYINLSVIGQPSISRVGEAQIILHEVLFSNEVDIIENEITIDTIDF